MTNEAIIKAAKGTAIGSVDRANRIIGLSTINASLAVKLGLASDTKYNKSTAKEVERYLSAEYSYLTFDEIALACDEAIFGDEKIYKFCAADIVRWVKKYASSEERQNAIAMNNAICAKNATKKAIEGPSREKQYKTTILGYWREIRQNKRFPLHGFIPPKADCFDWLCENGYITDGKGMVEAMLKRMQVRGPTKQDGTLASVLNEISADDTMRAKANCLFEFLRNSKTPPV